MTEEDTKSTREKVRSYVTELIGTFGLCFFGGMATGSNLNISLAHGMALTFFIYTGAGYSGAHYNPAVTLALMITKHIGPVDAVIYIAFQLVGGALAG
jgi:glycerol uptake facilitator protein